MTENFVNEQRSTLNSKLEEFQSKLEKDRFEQLSKYQDLFNKISNLAFGLQNRMALFDENQTVIKQLQLSVGSYTEDKIEREMFVLN